MICIYIVVAILIFGLLIFIHELGHYICARIFDVGIYEFAIGMGPKIFTHTSKKTGIAYSLRLLPIGGFVSMVGEDEESFEENAFSRKPVWQRMIITVAGAAMNILLGAVLALCVTLNSEAIGGTTVAQFVPDQETGVSITEQSGLRVGDTILSIGGRRVHISDDLVYTIMRKGVEPADVLVMREGEKLLLEDVKFPTVVSEGALFGTRDFYIFAEEKNVFSVIKHTFYKSVANVRLVWESLYDMLTGKYGLEQVSGPVGVTGVISEEAKKDWSSLLPITVLITMNLGVMNLLPIPALDGGKIFFQLIELIRRKPIDPKIEGIIHFVGLVLLMGFMLLITFKDIVKLITG
ncbi:MAG: RIP metalloprotease RseP [Ruminococcaceae bacterium]|nr:RIP metalloprotease RseP [Oscillospiraceae bacterium]